MDAVKQQADGSWKQQSATFGDFFTSIFGGDTALIGGAKIWQSVGLFFLGWWIGTWRVSGSWNPFISKDVLAVRNAAQVDAALGAISR